MSTSTSEITAPQLMFYAADRNGRTAIVHTQSRRTVAWIERTTSGALRARNSTWISAEVETVPQAIHALYEAWQGSKRANATDHSAGSDANRG